MSNSYYEAIVSDVKGCKLNKKVQKLFKGKTLSEDGKTLKVVGCYEYSGPFSLLVFDGIEQYKELAKIKDGLLWSFKDEGELTKVEISINKKWHTVALFNENLQFLDIIYYDLKHSLERKETVDLMALLENIRGIIADRKHEDTYGLTEIDLLNIKKADLLNQVESIKQEIKAKKHKDAVEPELF